MADDFGLRKMDMSVGLLDELKMKLKEEDKKDMDKGFKLGVTAGRR